MRNKIALLVALLAVAFLALTGCGGNAQNANAPNARYVSEKYSESVAQISMRLDEDVKMVLLRASLDDNLSEMERKAALIDTLSGAGGSGFAVRLVGDEVWFITNRHVATAYDKPTVSLDREKSTKIADIIYVSDRNDLAVIAVKAKDVPLFKIGGLAYEGEHVLSLGYPGVRGEGQVYQAAEGVVSNKCFKEDKDNGSCLIQHTATIDHGNSGGPLVDSRTGAVVGVNTWGYQRSGMSTAYVSIPADHIAKVLSQAAIVYKSGQDKAWRQAELLKTVQEYIDEQLSAEPNQWHQSYMVSSKLIVRSGMDNYRQFQHGSKAYLAARYGLMAVMAYATEQRINQDLTKACEEEETAIRVNATDIRFGTHDRARVILRCGKVRREMMWTYEYGRWQIVDYFSKPMEKENASLDEARVADKLIADLAKELAENELACARGEADACKDVHLGKGLLLQEPAIREFVPLANKCDNDNDETACRKAMQLKSDIFRKARSYANEAAAAQQAIEEAAKAAKAKAAAEAAAKAKAEEEAAKAAAAKAAAEAEVEHERLVAEARAAAEAKAKAKAEEEAKKKAEEEAKKQAEECKKDATKCPPPPPPPACAPSTEPPPGCNTCPCPEEKK